MAKNKGGDKKAAAAGGKGKGGKQEKEVKGAQSINVRHILVRFLAFFVLFCFSVLYYRMGVHAYGSSARSIRRRRRPWRSCGLAPSLTRWRGSSRRTRRGRVCFPSLASSPRPVGERGAAARKLVSRGWADCVLGGLLGWKPRGSLDAKFEEVAFSLEVSSTGNPRYGEAKTQFGYHIIMVRFYAHSLFLQSLIPC